MLTLNTYVNYNIYNARTATVYTLQPITYLLSILKKLLIVGSSAPSHLVLVDWDLEQVFGILLKHFDKYYCMIMM